MPLGLQTPDERPISESAEFFARINRAYPVNADTHYM